MATQVQIVNLALQRLGCERITLLTDNNKRAKLMTDLYDITLNNVLSSYAWSFSIKEVTLETPADDSGGTSFQYAYEYDLPSDHVRVIKEYDDNFYKVIGSKVQTDEGELNLTYISDSTTVTDLPADFVKIFYMTLALDASNSLTQDKALTGQIFNELEAALQTTRFNDSRESSVEEFDIDSYLDVRY